MDEALERLRHTLHPVAETDRVAVTEADGLFLAEPVSTRRANPPVANAAVDGYALAGASFGEGAQTVPLLAGRAAPGAPFGEIVPEGHAVRILTGAAVPVGVDTVVLEEDCAIEATRIAFHGPLKVGANTRRMGEDVKAGYPLFSEGHRLRPQDLALLAATGNDQLTVHRRLRVGVVSTGSEVREPGAVAADHEVWDANRPMLLAQIARLGFEPVDLGHVPDDRAQLRQRLDDGALCTDAILTSGGASAGDEDHVSALLSETGALGLWRIAIKPGRPLALATWKNAVIFGLPGNPVAAFVCTLVFAAPALRRLAGGEFEERRWVMVPAAFEKRKKAGRREFLRARLNGAGEAEVFRSEGSGRISGLTWSDGLVELPDGAVDVRPGTPVRYIAYDRF
ncbi:MAG: gephyrin-like molybdotransferase Glp [Pseudomonadota bacterium]